ncbi:MAG: putative RNA polymerase sigma factor [Arcticibacterium sp.]
MLQVQYSPMAALNRTYALAKVKGKVVALKEALKIKSIDNNLYHKLLAELYGNINTPKVKEHLQIAYSLAATQMEKKLLKEKLDKIV